MKPPTKWEQYARLKGIKKTKKSRMMWDEETKVSNFIVNSYKNKRYG